MSRTLGSLIAAVSLLILCGCGSDSTATADEEKMFKNPVKGTAPTAEQMKPKGPAYVGEPQSTPVPASGGKTASPPPGGGVPGSTR